MPVEENNPERSSARRYGYQRHTSVLNNIFIENECLNNDEDFNVEKPKRLPITKNEKIGSKERYQRIQH